MHHLIHIHCTQRRGSSAEIIISISSLRIFMYAHMTSVLMISPLLVGGYPRVDLSRFSRQFGKIVPRGRAQAASRPFAPAIIVTARHDTRATSSRAGETRASTFIRVHRPPCGSSARSERRFHHGPRFIVSRVLPLMRVPPCGNWSLLL